MTEELYGIDENEKKCGCKKGLLVAAIVTNTIATLFITILMVILVLGVIIPNSNFEFGIPKVKQSDEAAPAKLFKGKSISHEDAMKDDKVAVVLFYADWCPHCQHFAPTFQKLAKDRKLKKKYNFVRVNSEDQEAYPLMQEYNVEGFPSLFLVNPQTGEKHFVENGLLFTDDAKESLTEIIETFANKELKQDQEQE